jgi:hypothetical protein
MYYIPGQRIDFSVAIKSRLSLRSPGGGRFIVPGVQSAVAQSVEFFAT